MSPDAGSSGGCPPIATVEHHRQQARASHRLLRNEKLLASFPRGVALFPGLQMADSVNWGPDLGSFYEGSCIILLGPHSVPLIVGDPQTLSVWQAQCSMPGGSLQVYEFTDTPDALPKPLR